MAKLNDGTNVNYNSNHWDKIQRFDSSEGNVLKLVFEKDIAEGSRPAVVESVLYKYPTYSDRTVICCSTQSGCPVGCRFCGAGDYFVRSLSPEEIVDQVNACISIASEEVSSDDIEKLQIMFMSMGEPALNQKNLATAIMQLNELYPHARLLISTSAPSVSMEEIMRVSEEVDQVGLQFSIHESTDSARAKLIPTKTMSLNEIARAGEEFFTRTGRRPFFNYCAHDNNSNALDVIRLTQKFNPRIWCATVSVICERNEGLPARNEHQVNLASDFASLLVGAGYDTRVFDPAGQDDIGGGCGQLWYVQETIEEHLLPLNRAKRSKGHGLPKVHVPT